jgi:hypothetical protein
MLVTLENVEVLEISTRDYEGKTYRNLIVYEYGQRFPSVRVLRLFPDRVDVAEKLVGKRCSLTANLFAQKGKDLQLTFQGVAA